MAVRITSVAASASNTGTLKAGATVTFMVGINQPVEVTGAPVLLLNTGGVAVYDPILSRATQIPAILYFRYVVRSGDATADLTVVSMSTGAGSIHSDGSLFLAAPKDFAVGSQPLSIAAANVDKDSMPDLVVTNYGDDTVSVLINEGIPALNAVGLGIIKFGAAKTFDAGEKPTDVVVADFDRNTQQDLVVTNAGDNAVSFLRGDGNGNFIRVNSTPTGPGPVSVVAGLLDDDNKLDIAVANGNKTVSVLRGDGDGTFFNPDTYTVGSAPDSVKAVDVDKDGDLDIVVVNARSNSVSVLKNNGSGEYGSATTYRVGSGPTGLVVADVNGDGKVDLIVANNNDDEVSVLLGDGDGGFGEQRTFDTGDGPVAIAVGDLSGDGKVDIVTANRSGSVSVLQGVGDGTFFLPYTVPAGATPVALALADFDNDGLLDVAIANSSNGTISILQNASVTPGDLVTSSLYVHAMSLDTHFVVDGAAPTVLGRSSTAGSFGVGRALDLTVTFSEPVTVTGAPSLVLNDGGTASYVSGSGTATLLFRTTILAGQNAATLAVTAVTQPTGTTIFDQAGNFADLSRAVGTFTGVVIDTTAPTITGDAATPASGRFGIGQTIDITVTGTEKLTVVGTPTLTLNDGGSALYVSGSGTANLVFRYTVGVGQNTAALAVTGTSLPGGATIRDAAGNTATLTGARATFTGVVIDTTVPVVSSVTATPGVGQIEVGQTVTFTLTFSEAVKLTGAVVLTLNDGGTAAYVSGSNSTSLVFRTTIAAGQNAASLGITGVTVPTGGSVTAVSNVNRIAYLGGAVRSFAAISVDTSGPAVRSVTATPGDATLQVGAVITLSVVLSKIVVVTGGVPTLTLNDGAVARYASGSGSDTLVFTVTVAPGQVTPDLAVTALNLNGAVIADRAGRVADLAGAVANPAGTLEISAPAVTVASITAVASATGPLGAGRTVTFTAALDRGVAVTGSPTLALNDGGTATYVASASTSTSLVFRTTVAAGQNAANLAVSAFNLNGGTVAVPSSPLSFTSPTQYLVAGGAGQLVIADVNRDGQPDLIAGGSGTTLSLGDGNGGLYPATTAINLNVQGFAVGDVNRDGNPDIIGAGVFSGLTVSLGDGQGGFVTTLTLPGSDNLEPWAVTLGDVNGDGALDIVSASSDNAKYIIVALGDGAGGFAAASTYAAPSGVYTTIATADVNGDGKLDAVLASLSYGVSVLLGNGAGGFGAAIALPGQQSRDGGRGLVIADLNGDGRLDIASASRYSTTVWLGQAGGGFDGGTDFDGDEGSDLAAADVNGDGTLDLVLSSSSEARSTFVLLGNGQGGFGALTPFALPYEVGYYGSTLAVGDLDNDGRPDFIEGGGYVDIAGVRYSRASVYLNSTTAPNVFDPAGIGSASGRTTGLVVDTTAPLIVADTAAPARGSYDVGQVIDIALTGNEALIVVGAPVLTLNDGGTATYVSGSGTTSLLFRTTVAAGQGAATLAVTGVTLPTGTTIRDAAGNDANLAGAVASFGGLSVVTTAPAVLSVAASLGSATVGAGAVVTFSVVLNKPVSVARGAPTLTLSDGGVARYMSGSGTDTLVFSTTVATGQATADLAVTSVSLNGAVVADRAGRVANLAGAVANPAGTLAVATAAVTVTGITATPLGAGALGVGQTVRFTATVDRVVTVSAGVPTLALNDGGTASYDAAASTATSLVFRHTVAAGQNTANLAVTALTLNGAAIAVPGGLSFGTAVPYATGTVPSGASVADVNGDGKADLIVTNGGAATVSVLLGTGTGTFAPAVNYALGTPLAVVGTGGRPQSATIADVNGDGRPDLLVPMDNLVGGFNVGTVWVLLGTGAGSFGVGTPIQVNNGSSSPSSVLVADLNADGSPDLLVDTGYSVAVLRGDGAGGFSAAGQVASGFSVTGTTADVNGDGRLDLITVDTGDQSNFGGGVSSASVLLGNSSGGFGVAATYALGNYPTAVTAADVNGDGTPDLVVANALGGDISVLLGNGLGGFGAAANYGAGVSPNGVLTADVNGDGKLDVVVTDVFREVRVLLGDGAGGFGTPTVYSAGSTVLGAAALGDVNGDGKPDLVAASVDGNVYVLTNGSTVPGVFSAAGIAAAPGASTGIVVDTTTPSVSGTAGGQGVADDGTIRPFAGATVSHDRPAATTTVTITVLAGGVASDANGTLAGTGLTRAGVGTYTLATGSPAAVTTALRALVFTPTANQVAPGTSVTTGFGVSVSDGVRSVLDAATTVQAMSVNDAPVVGGTLANQATTDTAPVNPFSTVTVGDADVGQTATATVTFAAANGFVSNDTGSIGPGRYTVSGTAGQVQAALRSLAFTPTLGQAAPGQTVGTGFNLAVADGVTTTLDLTTSVAATSVACYVAGTLILTDRGETAVQTLAIGDVVVTASGAHRRIKWLGRRSYSGRFLASNPGVQPIRIRARALGGGLPRRDLLVSPEHAMFLDGVLVPARHLADGGTVVREGGRGRVDYHHVELDSHDVLLAEGAASETFLDDDSRAMFHNAAEFRALYPDAVRPGGFCARRVESGPELQAIRDRIREPGQAFAMAAA